MQSALRLPKDNEISFYQIANESVITYAESRETPTTTQHNTRHAEKEPKITKTINAIAQIYIHKEDGEKQQITVIGLNEQKIAAA